MQSVQQNRPPGHDRGGVAPHQSGTSAATARPEPPRARSIASHHKLGDNAERPTPTANRARVEVEWRHNSPMRGP
eukprot:5644678-Alexandrium_andersonii.AAC.1